MTLLAGQVPTDAEWEGELLAGRIVKRGNRGTNSTPASAAQGVLRVDSVPIVLGRSYLVVTSPLLMIASIANDSGTARISYKEGGTAATTDTTIAGYNSKANLTTSANLNGIGSLIGRFTAASTGTASILLWTQRLTGTGNISLSAAFGGVELMILDAGVDPGDSGVDI